MPYITDKRGGGNFHSTFDPGLLSYVQVSLPEVGRHVIRTPIGEVLADDHLLFSKVGLRQNHLVEEFPEVVEDCSRLDMITTPRTGSTRFAAASIFLGYKGQEDTPSFYLVEVGLVNGEPRQLYFSSEIDGTIVNPTGYRATPFSRENHFYKMSINTEGDAIKSAKLDAFESNPQVGDVEPYMHVSLAFNGSKNPQGRSHLLQNQQARMRVGAIADSMGYKLKSPVHKAYALAGKFLPWIIKPGK